MTKTVYHVALVNGRFDHVRGKNAAVLRAAEMIGVTAAEIRNDLADWGVTIHRVSPAVARSVGL